MTTHTEHTGATDQPTDELTAEVTAFLTAALRRSVGPDDDYFALGLVDSLFALELVTFVEERFAVTVEVEDLDLDSFRTARRVSSFVRRKTGDGPAGATSAATAPGSADETAPRHDRHG